jgi:hypothetical protein
MTVHALKWFHHGFININKYREDTNIRNFQGYNTTLTYFYETSMYVQSSSAYSFYLMIVKVDGMILRASLFVIQNIIIMDASFYIHFLKR